MNIFERRQRNQSEQGITIGELLLIILVSALILLVLTPLFINGNKSKELDGLRAEVRNAGMNMEQSIFGNNNEYPPYVMGYVQSAPENILKLDLSKSNANKFCLIGTHKGNPEKSIAYDSSMGGILPSGQECINPSAGNWVDSFKNKKALIVYSGNDSIKEYWTENLELAGFGVVDYKENPNSNKYKDYDLIVAASGKDLIPYEVVSNIKSGFDTGSSIIVEGVENDSQNLDFLISESSFLTATEKIDMNKTQNPVEPAFPYAFENVNGSFTGAYSCNTKLHEDAIAFATMGDSCITGAVMSNEKGGRIAYASLLSEEPTGQSLSQSLALWAMKK